MNKKIVHLVKYDNKFTDGYINFMKICMSEYDHIFVTPINCLMKVVRTEEELTDKVKVIQGFTIKEIAFGKKFRNILCNCDKVIVSGFFGFEGFCTFWPSEVFKKMYIHFWGGDFYELRKPVSVIQWRKYINRILKRRCFRKCAAAVFLIDGEYEKFYEITHIKKNKVFVAAMPGAPQKKVSFEGYRNHHMGNEYTKIVVGNSATEENHQIEVFKMLERFCGEKVEIYCPLSYGDISYREKVIKEGTDIFGVKFHAITEWMEIDKYYYFLSTCDIGIFNNDRQQAMGNIWAMLSMGKKIYLRTNVSMYNNYIRRGFEVYPVEEVSVCSFEQLKYFDKYEQNIQAADKWNKGEEDAKAWRKVFEA